MSTGRRDFLRFAIVGAGGFVVDAGAFMSFLLAGTDPYIARAASALLALTATWWVNREWTFRTAERRAGPGTYPLYLAVQSGGLAVNYVVFAAVQAISGDSPMHSFLALAAGSTAALVVNFASARGIVFRRTP